LNIWFVTTQRQAAVPYPPKDAGTKSAFRSRMYQVYSLKARIDILPLHTAILERSQVLATDTRREDGIQNYGMFSDTTQT